MARNDSVARLTPVQLQALLAAASTPPPAGTCRTTAVASVPPPVGTCRVTAVASVPPPLGTCRVAPVGR